MSGTVDLIVGLLVGLFIGFLIGQTTQRGTKHNGDDCDEV